MLSVRGENYTKYALKLILIRQTILNYLPMQLSFDQYY